MTAKSVDRSTIARSGGIARAANLSPEKRSELAKKAAESRWGRPKAEVERIQATGEAWAAATGRPENTSRAEELAHLPRSLFALGGVLTHAEFAVLSDLLLMTSPQRWAELDIAFLGRRWGLSQAGIRQAIGGLDRKRFIQARKDGGRPRYRPLVENFSPSKVVTIPPGAIVQHQRGLLQNRGKEPLILTVAGPVLCILSDPGATSIPTAKKRAAKKGR
jgi:hypothetical protein